MKLKKVKIKVPVESPFYGDFIDGAILKDNGDSLATLSVTKNIPPFAKKFDQFDLGEMVRKVVPDWTDGEDPIECWSDEDQEKIKKVYRNFYDSYTRIFVEPDFGDLKVGEIIAKRFRDFFEVPNDRVREAIEYCRGILVE